MSAYMDLNDVPAREPSGLLQDILRRDLGFRGFVISDACCRQPAFTATRAPGRRR